MKLKYRFFALALLALTACDRLGNGPVGEPSANQNNSKMFTVTLESLVGGPSPLSPGIFLVHQGGMPIFEAGKLDRGQGLESNAEDGNPATLLPAIPGAQLFNMPVGDTQAGPATPGKKFEFSFTARPGDSLSFVTMFGQSNDAFYAPMPTGLPLFNGNTPISGDVSSQITLWDAGTEVNEQPGTSTSQAARQKGANVGPSESQPIVPIAQRNDGFTYGQALKMTIEAR